MDRICPKSQCSVVPHCLSVSLFPHLFCSLLVVLLLGFWILSLPRSWLMAFIYNRTQYSVPVWPAFFLLPPPLQHCQGDSSAHFLPQGFLSWRLISSLISFIFPVDWWTLPCEPALQLCGFLAPLPGLLLPVPRLYLPHKWILKSAHSSLPFILCGCPPRCLLKKTSVHLFADCSEFSSKQSILKHIKMRFPLTFVFYSSYTLFSNC